MPSKIPPDHQLCIVLTATSVAEKNSNPTNSAELRLPFRASLLQALYKIDQSQSILELANDDAFFQAFLDCPQEFWTDLRRLQQDTIENHTLSRHLDYVVLELRKIAHDELARKIVTWANVNCPKPVIMRDYLRSPLISVHAHLNFATGTGMQPISLFSFDDGFFTLNSPTGNKMAADRLHGPLDWYGNNPAFGLQVNEASETENSDFDSVELVWQNEYLEDFMFSEPQCEPYRPPNPHYPGWEPFREHLQHVVDACKKYDPELSALQLGLQVVNEFNNVPMNLDALAYYFNVIPQLPPNIRPAPGADLSIEANFPLHFARLFLNWTVGYETPEELSLRTWVEIKQNQSMWEEQFKLRLPENPETLKMGFSAWWVQTTKLDEALDRFDQLKSSIDIAFHAAITDRTREIMEEEASES